MESDDRDATRAAAINVCAALLLAKPRAGRRLMTLAELAIAAQLPWIHLEAAIIWATRHHWLRRELNDVELRAAGIYVAKQALDLPR